MTTEARDYSGVYSSSHLSETPKQEIHRLHSELRTIGATAISKAIRIGLILTSERAKVKHGDWLLWVESNAPFTARMASNYMRLFDNKDEVSNRNGIADALLALQDFTENTSSAPCEPISTPNRVLPPPPKSAEDFEKDHAGNDGAPVLAPMKPIQQIQPRAKPTENAKPKWALAIWKEVREDLIGRAINRVDALHKECPNGKEKEIARRGLHMAFDAIERWNEAFRQ